MALGHTGGQGKGEGQTGKHLQMGNGGDWHLGWGKGRRLMLMGREEKKGYVDKWGRKEGDICWRDKGEEGGLVYSFGKGRGGGQIGKHLWAG